MEMQDIVLEEFQKAIDQDGAPHIGSPDGEVAWQHSVTTRALRRLGVKPEIYKGAEIPLEYHPAFERVNRIVYRAIRDYRASR
jgi:hypothetical protein